jgi:hypothetical protein
MMYQLISELIKLNHYYKRTQGTTLFLKQCCHILSAKNKVLINLTCFARISTPILNDINTFKYPLTPCIQLNLLFKT